VPFRSTHSLRAWSSRVHLLQSGRDLKIPRISAQFWPSRNRFDQMWTCWSGALPVVHFNYELCSITTMHLQPSTTVGEMKIWQRCYILRPELGVVKKSAEQKTTLVRVCRSGSWQRIVLRWILLPRRPRFHLRSGHVGFVWMKWH
jgi:hypothetical protein